jgi:hypothetical protein
MKRDPKDPIKTLHEELTGIQESVFLGDMSETDLNNWFFQFCEDIGCPVNEAHMEKLKKERKRRIKKFSVNDTNWCCDEHGWESCKCDPLYHDCTKRGCYDSN